MAVCHVIDALLVPILTETPEVVGTEAVLSHDGKVCEEAGGSLDEANLQVRHANEARVDEAVCLWVTGATKHDVGLSALISERNGGNLCLFGKGRGVRQNRRNKPNRNAIKFV